MKQVTADMQQVYATAGLSGSETVSGRIRFTNPQNGLRRVAGRWPFIRCQTLWGSRPARRSGSTAASTSAIARSATSALVQPGRCGPGLWDGRARLDPRSRTIGLKKMGASTRVRERPARRGQRACCVRWPRDRGRTRGRIGRPGNCERMSGPRCMWWLWLGFWVLWVGGCLLVAV
jgi:hypothetical protein